MQTKNTKCAICIIPPIERLSYIQSIRSQYDKAYERWMPHINLVFPFVNSNDIDSVTEKLQKVMKDVKPFEISFDRFGSFKKKKESTVHLIPEDEEGQMQAIYELIHMTLDLKLKEFNPHLTVGQFLNEELEKNMETLVDEFEGHEFGYMCKELHIIERGDNTPFKVRSVIKLSL